MFDDPPSVLIAGAYGKIVPRVTNFLRQSFGCCLPLGVARRDLPDFTPRRLFSRTCHDSADAPRSPASEDFQTCISISSEDLAEALLAFRSRGTAVVWAVQGEAGEALWSAACDIVEGLLLGVQKQLPHIPVDVDLQNMNSESDANEVLAITVRFGPAPLVGEFATRSRMGAALHLAKSVRFALRKPGKDDDPTVVMNIEGVEFHVLPDSERLRPYLMNLLGKDFNRDTVFSWWEQHKDEYCPLQTSKMRWVIESLLSDRTLAVVLSHAEKADMVWGFLNSAPTRMATLEFHNEGRAGITVTTTRRPPPDDAAAELQDVCDANCRQALHTRALLGDACAASSFSYIRMVHGHSVGKAGGNSAKIAKLLSAATSWGPGSSGWQRWDRTWLCVDRRDRIRGVVTEQGRVVWIDGDSDSGKHGAGPAMPAVFGKESIPAKSVAD